MAGFLANGARAAVVVAVGLIAAPPAFAQDLTQQWTYCENHGDQFAMDLAIGGCTAIIQSGRQTTANLAIAFFNRGHAYQFSPQPDYDKAIADYSQSVALNPNFAAAFNNRGEIYRKRFDFPHAIADYTQAIALDPHMADAFNNRGLAYKDEP